MTEEKFAEFLKTALDDLDPVPAAPRDEMWQRIQAQRALERQARRTPAYRTWINWGVGAAAVLAVGIGIGRMTLRQTDAPAPARVAAVTPATPNQTAYKVVVNQYMASAEAMLTAYRTEPQGTLDPQIAEWARDLLTNTRLLLNSPAASDPKTAALLQDLEVIIAQIAALSAPSNLENEIIRDGMNKTAVMPRLRATQPAAGT